MTLHDKEISIEIYFDTPNPQSYGQYYRTAFLKKDVKEAVKELMNLQTKEGFCMNVHCESCNERKLFLIQIQEIFGKGLIHSQVEQASCLSSVSDRTPDNIQNSEDKK